MAMRAEDIICALDNAFPGATIDLQDLAGDADHYQVTVASEKFSGLSRVAQHKLVYAALGDKMGTTLHALAVTTKVK